MSEDTGGRQTKIPSWDGSSDAFQSYCEAALLYEQTTKIQDRYLAAPRLIGELQGAAKRLVVGQRPDWVSFNGGVSYLLQHLRRCLGKPQVPELTELLARYFKTSKRKHGELMGEYITRKCELYVRAQQAMNRMKPHHDRAELKSPGDWPGGWGPHSRRASTDSRASTDGGTEGGASEEPQAAAPTSATATASAASENSGPTARTNEDQGYAWSDWSWYGYGNSWSWQNQQSWSWQQSQPWGGQGYYTENPSGVLPELVPEFVQAWLLLQDAGLEALEKNTVIVATQGEMTLQRVAQELRNQFADVDLKKRDASRKYQGYAGEHLEGSDSERDVQETSFDAEAELTAEGYALWSETEGEIQGAMAALDQARRTLRGARERQKQVKQSRQYFRYGSGSRRSEGSSTKDGKIICLRCGKPGHKAAACTAEIPQASAVEMAPFICYAQDSEPVEEAWSAQGSAHRPSTGDAVAAGKAVIDCGATKSLGSAQALEQMMRVSKLGVSQVDTVDRPVFGFGNSSEDRCISTLHLNIRAGGKPGVMKIHALNRGAGPILLSVATLKALNATIDFGEGTMVLKNVDNRKLLTLEETQTGHLLLPLAQDLLAGAQGTSMSIPSLSSYLAQEDSFVHQSGSVKGSSMNPSSLPEE